MASAKVLLKKAAQVQEHYERSFEELLSQALARTHSVQDCVAVYKRTKKNSTRETARIKSVILLGTSIRDFEGLFAILETQDFHFTQAEKEFESQFKAKQEKILSRANMEQWAKVHQLARRHFSLKDRAVQAMTELLDSCKDPTVAEKWIRAYNGGLRHEKVWANTVTTTIARLKIPSVWCLSDSNR